MPRICDQYDATPALNGSRAIAVAGLALYVHTRSCIVDIATRAGGIQDVAVQNPVPSMIFWRSVRCGFSERPTHNNCTGKIASHESSRVATDVTRLKPRGHRRQMWNDSTDLSTVNVSKIF